MKAWYSSLPQLVLGNRASTRVPRADQRRQRAEVEEILRRLRDQPGVILADEVGMGKTYVALAVACSVAIASPRGPVVVMVPPNLVDKWEQDLKTFCELYLEGLSPRRIGAATRRDLTTQGVVRYGVARHSVELLKLLDDAPRTRAHLIFLAQGAMGLRQGDKWVRLALVAEALRRHGTGKANRLIEVKKQIHRFMGKLLWAVGEEKAHDWGAELWQELLHAHPQAWREIYNGAVHDSDRALRDDPVPKAVTRALRFLKLNDLAQALKQMPVRAVGDEARLDERLNEARHALRGVEDTLWKELLARATWRSPLLVMDEAHHLKNPATRLARQLQSADSRGDLKTGDGALASAFDRMLFLTATPFQLGHQELVRVLERFGDVRWDTGELGEADAFKRQLAELGKQLDQSQRAAIALQRSWSRLRPEDCESDVEAWWKKLRRTPKGSMSAHQRAVVDAFSAAFEKRRSAQGALRPWVVRHNKGTVWAGTQIARRRRLEGGAILGGPGSVGLDVPPSQLLPFFLAARCAVDEGKDLLGDALCSSYEAFRLTRSGQAGRDELDTNDETAQLPQQPSWHLAEFDRALKTCSGLRHPKVGATVQKVVDLWEEGEKVLIFAFYRRTCGALRLHISDEITRRISLIGERRLHEAGMRGGGDRLKKLWERIQARYFDDSDSPGRRALDAAIQGILASRKKAIEAAGMTDEEIDVLRGVMRRFLRPATTLVRCFPIAEVESIEPDDAVAATLDYEDGSGMSWREKFDGFISFLTDQCSTEERGLYLEAAMRTETAGIRVEDTDADDDESGSRTATLANVQVATGVTRRDQRSRLMRAFNTPFFPDILVCSEVMGEGVDLQRLCRYVVHHDLAWNPSAIEQRTGRVDRLGCKAEGRQPIVLFLPYLAGTADERQFRVMSDREQWFRIVMGQDAVAKLITPDSAAAAPLPASIAEALSFDLGLGR